MGLIISMFQSRLTSYLPSSTKDEPTINIFSLKSFNFIVGMSSIWIYILAPIVGSLIAAAFFYKYNDLTKNIKTIQQNKNKINQREKEQLKSNEDTLS